jgi:hypothetical protein
MKKTPSTNTGSSRRAPAKTGTFCGRPEKPAQVVESTALKNAAPDQTGKPDLGEIVKVYVTDEGHQARLSSTILFGWHLDVIKAAKRTPDGLTFQGKRHLIEDLSGWVANETNHEAQKKRGSRQRVELLSDACDAIKAALRGRMA